METKPHTVEIFTEVAPKYEFLNALMTAGRDRYWRETLLQVSESALGKKPEVALDLATGTGDVARMMANKWPQTKVIGSDPTAAMLDVAKKKVLLPKAPKNFQKIEWIEGVAEKIELEDASVDVITIAFGFRNVGEGLRLKAAEEALRVLKPGGVFAILELGLPASKAWKPIYKTLLRQGMPRFASLFGPRAAYDYLANSILEFPAPEQVKKLLTKAGFLAFAPRQLTLGMCWLYVGKKPRAEV